MSIDPRPKEESGVHGCGLAVSRRGGHGERDGRNAGDLQEELPAGEVRVLSLMKLVKAVDYWFCDYVADVSAGSRRSLGDSQLAGAYQAYMAEQQRLDNSQQMPENVDERLREIEQECKRYLDYPSPAIHAVVEEKLWLIAQVREWKQRAESAEAKEAAVCDWVREWARYQARGKHDPELRERFARDLDARIMRGDFDGVKWLDEKVADARAEAAMLREALEAIMSSGHDEPDPRISYFEVQIEREDWATGQKSLAASPSKWLAERLCEATYRATVDGYKRGVIRGRHFLAEARQQGTADTRRLDWFETLTVHKWNHVGAHVKDGKGIRQAIDAALPIDPPAPAEDSLTDRVERIIK